MALTPPSYGQPDHLAFAWVWINGVDVSLSSGRPNYLVELDYSRIADRGGNRLTVCFFDIDYDYIEGLITKSPEHQIDFQYGYTEGLRSPKYCCKIINYKPIFTIDGVKIIIEALSHGYSINEDPTQTKDEWEGKRIDEIVNEICDKRGWDKDVDICKEILENDSLLSTELVQKRFKQGRMRDIQFILEVLAPHAVREEDKSGDYRVYFDDAELKLHFHPPRLEDPPVRTFIYMRDKMSEVISFSPDISGAVIMGAGGGTAGMSFIHRQDGAVEEVLHNNQTTPEKTVIGGSLTEEKIWENERYSATVIGNCRDKEQADILVRDRWFRMFNLGFGGELQIHGDPRLNPFDVIKVMVITRDGGIHYSSGLYQVINIQDNISGGTFTSNLKLIRNGYPATEAATGDPAIGNINA